MAQTSLPPVPREPIVDLKTGRFSSQWERWLTQVQRALGNIAGIAWKQLDKSGSSLADIETRTHALLTSISGWTSGADAVQNKHISQANGKKWEDHVDASQNVHGIGAGNAVVGTGTAQTLTGKKFGGATDYSEFEADGTLKFVGTAHIRYGSFYGDNIAQAVTVSAADTYYEIGAGLSDGGSNGFTFQSSKELKCLVAGKYKVDYSLAVYTTVANNEIESAVMINSSAQANTTSHTEAMTANAPMSMSGTGILNLAVDDVVNLAVSNHTASNNITVQHANLTLVMVGG